ncbi:hypothetical protein [Ottowia sp.]|uniref:hypothetical protein n=1 Tax=Ottowia sp. TaxID=1898956 RepID=UPI002601F8BF|nr:hypothetical protein [Ottowia sp.]
METSDIATQHAHRLLITSTLPPWKRRDCRDEAPGPVPVWTGLADPPAIGSQVNVRLNRLGPGTVTAYAVHEGYLGVMVRIDDAVRPDWHRQQNPDNAPSLVFGAEIAASLPAQ